MNRSDPLRDASMQELLAGYADGELETSDCARVESIVADDRNVADELETQRRFGRRHARLWESTAPPQPSDGAWALMLKRLHERLAAPRPAPATVVSRRRLLASLAALAATILLALFLVPRHSQPVQDPHFGAPEPFVVAAAEDVEILRIMEADVELLVVGEPPLRRSLVLAAVEDVDGLVVVKDTDGMMPMVAMQPGPNSPMIVAPMAGK
jgi:anti-sigma-K factor RskA